MLNEAIKKLAEEDGNCLALLDEIRACIASGEYAKAMNMCIKLESALISANACAIELAHMRTFGKSPSHPDYGIRICDAVVRPLTISVIYR